MRRRLRLVMLGQRVRKHGVEALIDDGPPTDAEIARYEELARRFGWDLPRRKS